MEGYKRLFEHIDENGDGKISVLELQECVHLIIGKDILLFEEAEAAIVAHDSDNDGLLDFDDFMRLVEDGGTKEEKERELKEAFRMYEMEGCGCITPESLKRMLHRLGEKKSVDECRGMIATYDINGDGFLNFEEFVIMMRC